jgi:hypothetical protein
MVSRLGAMRGLLAGGAIAGGILAIVAASFALVAAAGAAAVALLRYGIAQADARRSEALRIEGLNTLRGLFGRVTASAAEFQAAMDRAQDSTSVGRDVLGQYARQLARMGLAGEGLSSSLEAMAIAQQVQGDRGAARFRAMVANARLTGRSVEDVAESFRRRLGPIAARQMLSIDNQTARLHRNLLGLFNGLRIEGFLSAIHEITNLFSQSTASGRALKTIMEALFQPVLDGLGAVGPIARSFFEGMVIGALLVTIGVLRVRNALREAFGDSTLLSNMDAKRIATYAGVIVVGALAGALLVAVGILGAIAAVVAVATFTMSLFVAPLVAAGAALVGLVYAGVRAFEWARSADWSAIGRQLVDGLVGGIRSGVGRVREAVTGLAMDARSALTSALQIRSPSRVFAGLGQQISAGLAAGVSAGVPQVEAAVSTMVDVPAGGVGGGGTSVSIGDVYVHVSGAQGDAQAMARSIVDELVTLLEGVGIQTGAPA